MKSKEAEKNPQKHSYLTELYTPTRVKQQHVVPNVEVEKKKESEAAAPVAVAKQNSSAAENYLNHIGKTFLKVIK